MTHRITLSVALALSLWHMAAAEDLSTQITVDRTAATELPPAVPLESISPVLPPLMTPAVTLRPSYYSTPSAYTPLADKVPLPTLTGLPSPDSYRGYLWLGYLPVYDRSVGAGYRLYASSQTHAEASLLYTGANWGGSENSRRKGLDVFGLQANAGHSFSKAANLSLNLRYRYTNAGAWGEDEYLRNATSQHINDFNIGLGYNGHNDRFDWKISAAYSHLSVSAARISQPAGSDIPCDNSFRANLEGGMSIGTDGRLSVGLITDVLNSGSEFTFNPAYTLTRTNFTARIGLKLSAGSNVAFGKLHIAPDVEVAWMPTGRLTAFIKADGGCRFFTLADQYAVSPFLTGTLHSVNTFTGVDGRIGLTFRPIGSLALTAFGSFESTDGLPVMTIPIAPDFAILTPVDSRVLGGGVKASYSWRRAVDLRGEVRFMQRGMTHASASNPYHASVTAELTAELHPIDRLTIEAGWKLRAGQRLWYDKEHFFALKNFSDLSLGGSYALTEHMDVFLRFTNMLCRRTVIIPGVTSQRLGGLCGVSIRF